MTKTLDEKQNIIINELSGYTDWFDLYEYLIMLGKKESGIDAQYKTEENKIPGCQSSVWIYHEIKNNVITFYAESDALITKGIIALILRVVNNNPPQEVADADLYFLDRVGLADHLSPSRANGLTAIVEYIKQTAAGL